MQLVRSPETTYQEVHKRQVCGAGGLVCSVLRNDVHTGVDDALTPLQGCAIRVFCIVSVTCRVRYILPEKLNK